MGVESRWTLGPDLGQEAFGAEDGGELGAEDLEGDLAVVLQGVGEVDGGHAAAAERAFDGVAVGEAGAQGVQDRHGDPVARCGRRRWLTQVLTPSTTERCVSVGTTRRSRNPDRFSKSRNSARVRSRPRGVSTSI